MEITIEELKRRCAELFGPANGDAEFVCPMCKRVQSANSIIKQMKDGTQSKRFGMLKKGDGIDASQACYAPDCDWSANGLFTSGILVILDESKPHNASLKKNCSYVFPLAGDDEMLEAAGIDGNQE